MNQRTDVILPRPTKRETIGRDEEDDLDRMVDDILKTDAAKRTATVTK